MITAEIYSDFNEMAIQLRWLGLVVYGPSIFSMGVDKTTRIAELTEKLNESTRKILGTSGLSVIEQQVMVDLLSDLSKGKATPRLEELAALVAEKQPLKTEMPAEVRGKVRKPGG